MQPDAAKESPRHAEKSFGRVLIADKDGSFVGRLKETLTQAGYQTTQALNGDEALWALEHQAFDLALLDVVMPRRSGSEVCFQLKQNRRLAMIPVILMSSSLREMQGMTIQEERFRADDFLLKPFDTHFLLDKIQSHLRRKLTAEPTARKSKTPEPSYNIDDVLTMPEEESSNDFTHFRYNPRAPLNIPVDYRSAEIFFSSPMMNISKGGIFIQTDQPLPIGKVLALQFKLPEQEEPLKGQGRVVWTQRPGGSTPPGMGIRFKDFSEEDLRVVYGYVRRLRQLVR